MKKTTTKKLHIGKLIQDKIQEQGISITEFARRINRSSQSIYHILRQPSIDTELLLEINKVLKHNFFAYYISEREAVTINKKKRRISIAIDVENEAEQEKILKMLNINLK